MATRMGKECEEFEGAVERTSVGVNVFFFLVFLWSIYIYI